MPSAVVVHALPPLPYTFDALEPYIDARTMELHHGRHHATYVKRLNEALAGRPELQAMPLETLLTRLAEVPEEIRNKVRNNAGGHYNHSLFWTVMTKGGGGEPQGDLAAAIREAFGSFEAFKALFTKTAIERFGSGWAWLSLRDSKLVVSSTRNQDCPVSLGLQPILVLDVWEHAYYLEYQNRRKAYVEGWWNVVDWTQVSRNLDRARGVKSA